MDHARYERNARPVCLTSETLAAARIAEGKIVLDIDHGSSKGGNVGASRQAYFRVSTDKQGKSGLGLDAATSALS
jgi:hypothetical protein